MQNGKLRTSCRSRVIHQFWEQLVDNIDIAGCLQQVQPKSEVTNKLHEGGANHPPNPQSKIKRGMRDSDHRLRDLPEWLEEFTDNLEDTEVPASTHKSQDSDSERPTKVVQQSRKHGIDTHFLKAEIGNSACEPK